MSLLTHSYDTCPRCSAPTEKSKAMNQGTSEFWYNCTRCNTFINTYHPQAHQSAVHSDSARFVANFGGYGSGKTLTSRQEFYKHMFLTPKGTGLIGANVTSQYEQTIKRDIEADIPAAFIKYISSQKSYIEFINGYRLMFRPFDDVDKLRSYNIDFFLIVEASEVKFDAFVQLKSRIRNTAATTQSSELDPDTQLPKIIGDWRRGIIESNPDSGWVRSQILLRSQDIHKHGKVDDRYTVQEDEVDPSLSTHVTDSEENKYLPPGFIDDLKASRPDWWIKRYIYGSFMYSEGLVYPSAMRHVIPTFQIPRHWKRIAAFDYGLRDDAVFLFGAVDERLGVLFIYQEIRTNNKNIQELAKLFHQAAHDIPVGGWISPPLIDPKSAPKRDYNKKTLSDHFMDFGINFKEGHISLDARVFRLNTYLECGKLKIMDCCQFLIDELRDYKFIPKSLDKHNQAADKPEDKNNHAINPLEWIVMELPSDPANLLYGVYNKKGINLAEANKIKRKQEMYWALSDEPDYNQSFTDSDMQGYTGHNSLTSLF